MTTVKRKVTSNTPGKLKKAHNDRRRILLQKGFGQNIAIVLANPYFATIEIVPKDGSYDLQKRLSFRIVANVRNFSCDYLFSWNITERLPGISDNIVTVGLGNFKNEFTT